MLFCNGNLLSKVKPDGSATLYLGLYEVDLTSSGAVTKKTSYYPGGAMRVDIVGGANTLYYLLKDHLGSASTLLDSSGNIVANGEQRYYPFGENRIASFDLKTDHLFTGQLSVGLGGIYSYGARFYSPRLGRFLSADTVVPDWKYPQSLNRYSYVYNNPLKYVDPTGHEACYGTSDFISESTGDGGISWASCWARQRDKGILTDAGVPEETAQSVAAALDTLGAAGFIAKFANANGVSSSTLQKCPTTFGCTAWANFTAQELNDLSVEYKNNAGIFFSRCIINIQDCQTTCDSA